MGNCAITGFIKNHGASEKYPHKVTELMNAPVNRDLSRNKPQNARASREDYKLLHFLSILNIQSACVGFLYKKLLRMDKMGKERKRENAETFYRVGS